jgi:hypothetical protein
VVERVGVVIGEGWVGVERVGVGMKLMMCVLFAYEHEH